MAITLNRCLEMMARPAGLFVSSDLTANGNAGGTTLEDDSIVRYDTNVLKNKWVYLTSGTYSGESRRISTVAGSTITVTTAFGGQILDNVTYYILEDDPDVLIDALQQAARTLSGILWLPVKEEIVLDNLIATNHSFETAVSGGSSSGWTRVNTPTLTDETTLRMHLTNSLKVVAGGSAGRVYQAVTPNIVEAIGKTLHFRCWVYATAGSAARIGISYDGGTTFTYSDYHSGEDEWEDLAVDAAITADASSIRVYLEVVASGTAYFDLTRAWVDRVYQYSMPSTIPYPGPHTLEVQGNVDQPEGTYSRYIGQHRSGRLLRMRSMGPLTAPSTSSSIELTEVRGELLLAQAMVYAHQTLMVAGDRDMHKEQIAIWGERADRLMVSPGMRMKGMSGDLRTYWHTEESGETRTLILDR